eukprot:TRINITY_DN11639_c0_g5_i1.p1 TRINITY_DN11639_c0_g5~~TRINITY_DN11639_c0_g5_i1.p1  ORF type:complete len:314 (-),score=64.93 TRINITY_DN11639_c0_g5_i1:28-900(-)
MAEDKTRIIMDGEEEPPEQVIEEKSKLITMRLAMENSLTKAELDEYDELPPEGALEKAQSLTVLHLEWLSVSEISGLEAFESTEVIYMQHNRIERIECLDCLPKLQFLALQMNRIKKIENLLCLPALEFLDLSRNQIAELETDQLPQTINILRLRGNPCAKASDYKERILARLPDLANLDATPLQPAGSDDNEVKTALPGSESSVGISAEEKGLSAYWKKGALQANATAEMKEQVQAYSVEALADESDFTSRVASTTARIKARRDERDAVQDKKISEFTSSLKLDQADLG